MRYLIFFLFLYSPQALSDSLELMVGGITEHFIAPNGTEFFKTKLGDGGKLIYNPLYALRYNREDRGSYASLTVFTGSNSVGYPMTGASVAWGRHLRCFYVGGVLGAYKQEATFGNPTAFLDKVINTGVVPLVGLEINAQLRIAPPVFLKLNNLITPILSNTSVSLGVEL